MKSKLLKSLIGGLFMSLVLGTVAYAGTVEREQLVRNINYSDEYSGTVGYYKTTGLDSYTVLTIRNTANTPTLYYASVRAYNYASREYENGLPKTFVLNPGSSDGNSMPRDKREAKYRYEHIGEGFYSTTSSVRLDYYKFTGQQWEG